MMSERTASGLQIVAVGFGTSVAMWFAGYVTHLPAISLPAAIVLGVMVACILAGGVIAGRHAAGGALAAAAAGAVTAVLNLLILGSVVAGEKTNELLPAAWVWIPGSILLTVLLAAAGGAIGRRRPGRRLTGEDWRYRFALVAAAATLLLLVAGGVVTSTESGLAVPDWPSSFGSNMFLYPLARMTGGIYYEHAHRLAGTLVGLTTIALAVVVWVTERRAPLRVLGAAAVLMVVIQGLIGAAGVLNPSAAQPSIPLATVHGVFAQIFFVTIVVIAAAVSRAWREARPRPTEGAGPTARSASPSSTSSSSSSSSAPSTGTSRRPSTPCRGRRTPT